MMCMLQLILFPLLEYHQSDGSTLHDVFIYYFVLKLHHFLLWDCSNQKKFFIFVFTWSMEDVWRYQAVVQIHINKICLVQKQIHNKIFRSSTQSFLKQYISNCGKFWYPSVLLKCKCVEILLLLFGT